MDKPKARTRSWISFDEDREGFKNGLGNEITFCRLGMQGSLQDSYWNKPFNMVFGLDAILPMEFLIPTL